MDDGAADNAADNAARPSLADRINRLFETVHPADRGPYSDREVCEWLNRRAEETGGPTISPNYLRWLRTGGRRNPSIEHVRALATFFDIDPGYFLSDGPQSEAIYAELELLGALRDQDIRLVATRLAQMNPEMRRWVAGLVRDLPGEAARSPKRGREE